MTIVWSASALTLAAAPVDAGATGEPSQVVVFGAIALGALGLAWAVTWWVWRSPPSTEPAEHAFRALARRMRLNHAQKRLLRRMARSLRTEPVALTLCREAFDRAARRSVRASEAPEALALQERLFGRR